MFSPMLFEDLFKSLNVGIAPKKTSDNPKPRADKRAFRPVVLVSLALSNSLISESFVP